MYGYSDICVYRYASMRMVLYTNICIRVYPDIQIPTYLNTMGKQCNRDVIEKIVFQH